MKESSFQAKLRAEIEQRFPGSKTLKNDPSVNKGIPDVLVLYKDKWAALECKDSAEEMAKRKNQIYHVQKMNEMSFARFVCPENKEDVLNEMEQAFGLLRSSCFYGRK